MSETKLRHKVREKEQVRHVEFADIYNIDDFHGFDVRIEVDENRGCDIKFYPSFNRENRSSLDLGLLECSPKNVSDLEAFAKVASEMLADLASEMRKAGLVDLRSKWKKTERRI